MVTFGLKDILISILLIALIVLVVFLIVLVSKVTDSIKKANGVLEAGMSAVDTVKDKVDGVANNLVEKKAKISGLAGNGIDVAKSVVGKVVKK